jgi:prepilin peptidase CpaA
MRFPIVLVQLPEIEHLAKELWLWWGVLQGNPSTVALVGLVLVAAVVDAYVHRIPNVLTMGGVSLGLALQCWLHGWGGLVNAFAGAGTGFFIYLLLYAFGWMGAGDVKLMAAVGSFLGWPDTLLGVALSTGIGGIFALLVLIGNRGGLVEYLSRYGAMARCLLTTGQFAYVRPAPEAAASRSFPYAWAIAAGTLATLWRTGHLEPFLRLCRV